MVGPLQVRRDMRVVASLIVVAFLATGCGAIASDYRWGNQPASWGAAAAPGGGGASSPTGGPPQSGKPGVGTGIAIGIGIGAAVCLIAFVVVVASIGSDTEDEFGAGLDGAFSGSGNY